MEPVLLRQQLGQSAGMGKFALSGGRLKQQIGVVTVAAVVK